MTEKFEIHKAHKMQEWIEDQVTEWANDLIIEHFDVDTVDELSREHIDEVIEQWEVMLDYDGTLAMGVRNCINTWENENEEYII